MKSIRFCIKLLFGVFDCAFVIWYLNQVLFYFSNDEAFSYLVPTSSIYVHIGVCAYVNVCVRACVRACMK